MLENQTSILLNSQTNNERIPHSLRDLLSSISTVKKIEKGNFIFHEGLEANDIYIIKSGLVEISKLAANGKEMILRICKQQDIVGEMTLFSEQSKYMVSAKMIQAGEVYAINKSSLEKALTTNQELLFEYLKWMSYYMQKFQSTLRDLLLNGKKGALYSTLIRLSNSYGIQKDGGILISLPLTNQQLAKFCATSRETVNRMLADLRRKEIISIDHKGRILIKDRTYLKEVIGCEDCPIEICNIN